MSLNEPYLTLKESGEAEYDEKKSRFLSFCMPVKTEAEAVEFVQTIRSEYPDARHVVYAYTVSSSGTFSQRYSDDGEPQGTGGMPVLDVMRKKNLTDSAICVVRYFGGILLGAPGLVRAYSSAASMCVDNAGTVRMTPLCSVKIRVSYTLWGKVENAVSRMNYMTSAPEFDEAVGCTVYVSPDETERFKTALSDVTSGKISFEIGETGFFPVPVE